MENVVLNSHIDVQILDISSNTFYEYAEKQEGPAVARIARDDPSTVPGDHPSTTMRGKFGSEFET